MYHHHCPITAQDDADVMIDIRRVPELRGVTFSQTGMRIGATVTIAEVPSLYHRSAVYSTIAVS